MGKPTRKITHLLTPYDPVGLPTAKGYCSRPERVEQQVETSAYEMADRKGLKEG